MLGQDAAGITAYVGQTERCKYADLQQLEAARCTNSHQLAQGDVWQTEARLDD